MTFKPTSRPVRGVSSNGRDVSTTGSLPLYRLYKCWMPICSTSNTQKSFLCRTSINRQAHHLSNQCRRPQGQQQTGDAECGPQPGASAKPGQHDHRHGNQQRPQERSPCRSCTWCDVSLHHTITIKVAFEDRLVSSVSLPKIMCEKKTSHAQLNRIFDGIELLHRISAKHLVHQKSSMCFIMCA